MSDAAKRRAQPPMWAAHEALDLTNCGTFRPLDVVQADDGAAIGLRALRELALHIEQLRYCREPMQLILHCPVCHMQHIDEIDPIQNPGWDNPPHTSHKCLGCGCVWRPSERETEGVSHLPEHGRTDTWPAIGRKVPPEPVEAIRTEHPAGKEAPENCRDRLRMERKAYPRSGCEGCKPKNKHKFTCPYLGEC